MYPFFLFPISSLLLHFSFVFLFSFSSLLFGLLKIRSTAYPQPPPTHARLLLHRWTTLNHPPCPALARVPHMLLWHSWVHVPPLLLVSYITSLSTLLCRTLLVYWKFHIQIWTSKKSDLCSFLPYQLPPQMASPMPLYIYLLVSPTIPLYIYLLVSSTPLYAGLVLS